MTPIERKCRTCGGTMHLGGQTHHAVRLQAFHVVPLGEVSHGRTLIYVCEGCQESVSMLDGIRRGWFVYSMLVGAGLLPLGLWMGGGGILLSLLGAGLFGGFGAFVVSDALKRRRYPALDL